jgi:hypothetical protein
MFSNLAVRLAASRTACDLPRKDTVIQSNCTVSGENFEIGDLVRITGHVVGLRDRAAIGILIYTAARIGAVASLKRGSLTHDGSQWTLRFAEKGGNPRTIVQSSLRARIGQRFYQIREIGKKQQKTRPPKNNV